MDNFWKIASIILFLVCLGLGFMLFKSKSRDLKLNQMSLEDVNQEEYEYKKKQDPTNAKDLNDYFYKNQTKIRFLEDLYDFDTVPKGQDIIREIKYVNEGAYPYFITDIKVSCGCTVPSYDKEPVKPKDTGIVKIEFKSASKEGFVMNKLSLFGNVEHNEKSTYFKVFVKSK